MKTQTTAATEISTLEVGTEVILRTDDRAHPFRLTVSGHSRFGTLLDGPSAFFEIVYRDNGSISHVARISHNRRSLPTTSRVVSIVLAN